MLKERVEIRPEDKIEATPGAKDEFLYNIDVLTEKAEAIIKGTRIKSYELSDGRVISCIYTTEEKMKELKDKGITDDPTHAQFNIYEPFGKEETKETFYYLHKSGNIEMHIKIENFRKESDEFIEEEKAMERGEMDAEASLRKLQEENERLRALHEEEKKVGLAFVSEAELKEVNKLLRELVEQQKKQRTTK